MKGTTWAVISALPVVPAIVGGTVASASVFVNHWLDRK